MTAEELLAELHLKRAFMERIWRGPRNDILSHEQRIKLAGYDQAIIDVEEAIRATVAAPRADQEGC